MTRVLITGDRKWFCQGLARSVVDRLKARYGDDLLIVHGGASGVDLAFAWGAYYADVATEPHPADWKLGRKAGPLRNAEMVALGAAFAIAVHRDIMASKGTLDCARRCLEAGIPVWLIRDETGEPTRWEGM